MDSERPSRRLSKSVPRPPEVTAGPRAIPRVPSVPGTPFQWLPCSPPEDRGLTQGYKAAWGPGSQSPRWAPIHGWSASPSHPGSPGQGNCMCAKSLGRVRLCDPTDCRPPGSSVHGTLQARTLEWVAMPSSRGSSPSRDWSPDSLPSELPGRNLLL